MFMCVCVCVCLFFGGGGGSRGYNFLQSEKNSESYFVAVLISNTQLFCLTENDQNRSFTMFGLRKQAYKHLAFNTSTSFRNSFHCIIDDICHFDSEMEVYYLFDTDNNSLPFII